MFGMARLSAYWPTWFGKVGTQRHTNTTTSTVQTEASHGEPPCAENSPELLIFPANGAESDNAKPVLQAGSLTPLGWFRGQPRDMSLVIYIDQTTTQIMEMLAVSRRQAADLFRVPMYAGAGTRWQTLGAHRMRRMDFTPALVFQDQEDSLTELEGLLSARWYSSTELTNLDQAILRAFEASCTPDGAPVIGLPDAPDAITQLRELLQSRAVMSEEAKRIDETLISSFQKIGVALPEPSPPAG